MFCRPVPSISITPGATLVDFTVAVCTNARLGLVIKAPFGGTLVSGNSLNAPPALTIGSAAMASTTAMLAGAI